MIPYEKVVTRLKKLGYSENENISDFWFANKNKLMPRIYGKGRHDERFGLQVRWKSEIGIVCQKAVREYIIKKVTLNQQAIWDAHNPVDFEKMLSDKKYKNSILPISDAIAIIDFKDFKFKYKRKVLTIDDFEYSFSQARTSYTNLSGIDLSGMRLHHCTFIKVSFSCANFNHSDIFGAVFENCNLGYCSFNNTHLSCITLHNTLLSGGFEGATLSNISPFNDRTIHVPFNIKKVSYFKLLSLSIQALDTKKIITFKKSKKHTHFIAVTTKEIEAAHLQDLKNYIDWYQSSLDNSRAPARDTFKKRFSYFLSVLFTKNWTSFSVLALWFLIINIFFSITIYFGHKHFELSGDLFDPDPFQAFYHSIITFSVLGYGDLAPIDNWGRSTVLFEALIGYVVLGLFVFLLNRKIEKRI